MGNEEEALTPCWVVTETDRKGTWVVAVLTTSETDALERAEVHARFYKPGLILAWDEGRIETEKVAHFYVPFRDVTMQVSQVVLDDPTL